MIKRGDKLGETTLLEIKCTHDGFIVLCLCNENRDYVTWWYDGEKACAHGHYTDKLKVALKDFSTRT